MPEFDIDKIYREVKSLLVLHNILEDFGNNPDGIDGYDGEDNHFVPRMMHQLQGQDQAEARPANKHTTCARGALRRKVLMEMMNEDADNEDSSDDDGL
jgi:hypothetical protein